MTLTHLSPFEPLFLYECQQSPIYDLSLIPFPVTSKLVDLASPACSKLMNLSDKPHWLGIEWRIVSSRQEQPLIPRALSPCLHPIYTDYLSPGISFRSSLPPWPDLRAHLSMLVVLRGFLSRSVTEVSFQPPPSWGKLIA